MTTDHEARAIPAGDAYAQALAERHLPKAAADVDPADAELADAIAKGTEAWAGVPDGWVDDLRGGAVEPASAVSAAAQKIAERVPLPEPYRHDCTGDGMRCMDGHGCECEMAGHGPEEKLYTAAQMEALRLAVAEEALRVDSLAATVEEISCDGVALLHWHIEPAPGMALFVAPQNALRGAEAVPPSADDVTDADLRLHAGEMTASEVRACRAGYRLAMSRIERARGSAPSDAPASPQAAQGDVEVMLAELDRSESVAQNPKIDRRKILGAWAIRHVDTIRRLASAQPATAKPAADTRLTGGSHD